MLRFVQRAVLAEHVFALFHGQRRMQAFGQIVGKLQLVLEASYFGDYLFASLAGRGMGASGESDCE